MTPERLLIPLAELPGLDPVGLRSAWRWGGDDPHPIVTEVSTEGLLRLDWPEPDDDSIRWDTTTGWAYDLSDAATRDRVLRWIASRVGLEVGCGAPMWAFRGLWDLDGRDRRVNFGAAVIDRRSTMSVPSLADLDPTDDTRLPDGSRWVDALALVAVARHIGSTP